MAKRRRPSIPLTILFIIFLSLFLLAGPLVQIVSELTTRGSFTYTYEEGTESIVSITYTLPQDLADALVPKQTAGWNVNLVNNELSLTGGTLNPGESVTFDYRLSKYIAGGTRTITATGRTENGSIEPKQTPLQVPEAFLLAPVWMLYQNAIWLLIPATIVLVAIIVRFNRGNKRDKEQENKEVGKNRDKEQKQQDRDNKRDKQQEQKDIDKNRDKEQENKEAQ